MLKTLKERNQDARKRTALVKKWKGRIARLKVTSADVARGAKVPAENLCRWMAEIYLPRWKTIDKVEARLLYLEEKKARMDSLLKRARALAAAEAA